MTDPYFGRVLRSQDYMVSLAGWGLNNPDAGYWQTDQTDPGLLRDDHRAALAMCAGRIGLVRMSLKDFGFDIMNWRHFLMYGPAEDYDPKYGALGYMHPYAFARVDAVVIDGFMNPNRPRQVALAERLMPDALARQLALYQSAWNDPEEPLWLAAIEGWPFSRPAVPDA